jgi:hypothetical protein
MSFQVVSTRPVGALDVCDAELVNMPVERIGDAAYVPTDAKGSCIQIGGLRIAHLRHARAVQIETLVVRAGVLVVGADDIAPAAVPEGAGDVVLQPVVGPEEVPAAVVQDVASVLACVIRTIGVPEVPLATVAAIVAQFDVKQTLLRPPRREAQGSVSNRQAVNRCSRFQKAGMYGARSSGGRRCSHGVAPTPWLSYSMP